MLKYFLIFCFLLISDQIMSQSNLFIANIGFIGWLVVGMLWHDRALIVLNSISLAIYTLGIFNYYYG